MDSNRKRSRGLLKGKLMPFYRAPKPSPTGQYAAAKPSPTVQYTATKPSPTVQYTATKPSLTSLFVVHQVQDFSQPKPKVYNNSHSRDPITLEEIYSVAEEESVDVDIRAAKYISLVQERLRLERVSSE